jgi:1,4-dihydroxy-6-naphthoate synthase
MTSAFLALQLWLEKPASQLNYVVVPFDQIFHAVRSGVAEVGLIIHEGQLTYEKEGLVMCEDLGAWWGRQTDGLPLPLGGNVIHKRFTPDTRKIISSILTASIQFSLDHRPEAVQHALQYARDMGHELADRFVGMYVNDRTLDYGADGKEAIRRLLETGYREGIISVEPQVEFVE